MIAFSLGFAAALILCGITGIILGSATGSGMTVGYSATTALIGILLGSQAALIGWLS